jgi:hypothetical protein
VLKYSNNGHFAFGWENGLQVVVYFCAAFIEAEMGF